MKGAGAPAREFSWSLTSCPENGSILGIGREAGPSRETDDRFRLAVEAAPNAMMVVAPGGRIVLVNAETEKLFGYSREELLNLSVDALVPERFRPRHASSCAEYFGGPRTRTMGSGRDLLGLRKDGREIPIEIGLNPMSTREGTFAMVSLIDITERKRLEEKLRMESVRDPLTGLYNRRYLETTLDREIHRCGRKKVPLALVFMDVDRFKRFNDAFGHDAGDEVLREVGRILKTGTRHGDIACRYGGEEFVLALPETSQEPALRKAEELCRKMGETRLTKEGRPLGRVTLSAGVAAFPGHGSSPAEILKAADRALYRAKRGGRDRAALAR
jgi:diguanylate cyclase (GGDEF)-like protein/PAS domain S-box-containing protein